MHRTATTSSFFCASPLALAPPASAAPYSPSSPARAMRPAIALHAVATAPSAAASSGPWPLRASHTGSVWIAPAARSLLGAVAAPGLLPVAMATIVGLRRRC